MFQDFLVLDGQFIKYIPSEFGNPLDNLSTAERVESLQRWCGQRILCYSGNWHHTLKRCRVILGIDIILCNFQVALANKQPSGTQVLNQIPNHIRCFFDLE